jgi:hypothetical protein
MHFQDGGTVAGMAAQGQKWRRGHALLAWRHDAVSCGCRVGGCTPFRGFHRPLSRGATWGRYGSGRHSVTELTPAFPHSSRTAPGMAAQRGLVEQRRDMIPRRCQRADVAGIRVWQERPRRARAFNALVGGVGAASWVWGGLERGGVSPEGASGPRARGRLARGGVRPLSEAEFLRCGAQSSSETEIRPRGTAAVRLVGRCGFLGRGPFCFGPQPNGACFGVCGFVSLRFIIFRKGHSPRLLGDPYGCPRHMCCMNCFQGFIAAIQDVVTEYWIFYLVVERQITQWNV